LETHKSSEGIFFTINNEGDPISKELIANINGGTNVVSKRGTLGEKGTGVGLHIVNDFAKLHGGYLKIRAGETGGTVATVFFPFRSTEEILQRDYGEVYTE